MSSKPTISGRAEADLTSQYRWYFDNAGEQVAERFLAAFDRTVEALAQVPELGRRRRFRDPALVGLRSLVVRERFGAHLIFYRGSAAEISIERIMHGGRDLPRRLLEAPEDYPQA
jgi:plasmid stabilization system protein ParE